MVVYRCQQKVCWMGTLFRWALKSAYKKASKTEVFEAFWSCWADLNRRPHPYQLLGAFQPLLSNAFGPFLLQKDEVVGTLCSIVSVCSFPRVGQRVGKFERLSHIGLYHRQDFCAEFNEVP